MANKKIEQGLNALLNVTPQEQTQETEQEQTKREKKVYKAVCYNLHPDVIEKVKYIAHYDRKKVNEVITDALNEYFKNWKPTQEKPRKL